MFYTFSQNNSGGYFDEDDNVQAYVIIEAVDATTANRKATERGIYFGGMDDCPCCGDRWREVTDPYDADDEPSIHGHPVGEYEFNSPYNKAAIIYYADGLKETHKRKYYSIDRAAPGADRPWYYSKSPVSGYVAIHAPTPLTDG